jgi:release factor glutamine methyltransferase
MIYEPAEDSYLLSENLKDFLKSKDSKIKILDMGSGSGIQAQTCFDCGFKNVLCADINPEVISHLKSKKFKTIHTDLFSKIKTQFDLIIFNAPYLPEDKNEPEDSRWATTGGKYGYEIPIKFLEQAKSHLIKNGKILLLFSSLSKPKKILSESKKLGYENKKRAELKIPFEILYVYEFY